MKTYVFDASALFTYLQKKPSATKVNELLKQALDGRADVLMSAINFGVKFMGSSSASMARSER